MQPLLSAIASSAVALAFALVGAILTAKLPRHRIGWLLAAAGFCIALNSLTWRFLTNAYGSSPPSLPATGLVGMIGQLLGTPVALLCIGIALAVFPARRAADLAVERVLKDLPGPAPARGTSLH